MANRFNAKYDERFCDELIEHMSQGADFRSFAGLIGVTEHTIHNWKKSHPEFAEAYGIAVEKSYLWWERLARELKNKDINTGLFVINMRNRFRWQTRDVDTDPVEKLTDDEAYELWKRSRGER